MKRVDVPLGETVFRRIREHCTEVRENINYSRLPSGPVSSTIALGPVPIVRRPSDDTCLSCQKKRPTGRCRAATRSSAKASQMLFVVGGPLLCSGQSRRDPLQGAERTAVVAAGDAAKFLARRRIWNDWRACSSQDNVPSGSFIVSVFMP